MSAGRIAAVAGLLFVLYPVIRPFSDETSLQGAAAFGRAGAVPPAATPNVEHVAEPTRS